MASGGNTIAVVSVTSERIAPTGSFRTTPLATVVAIPAAAVITQVMTTPVRRARAKATAAARTTRPSAGITGAACPPDEAISSAAEPGTLAFPSTHGTAPNPKRTSPEASSTNTPVRRFNREVAAVTLLTIFRRLQGVFQVPARWQQ